MSWSVIGFEKEKKYFSRIIKAGVLSHAYLLSGPRMIGKKLLALDIYALLNGVPESSTDPDLCIITLNPDEGESHIPIEKIRELKSFLSFKAYKGPYKCVIIDYADRMTTEASNALLKALEEPQDKVVMFLISSQPKMLLPTIVSRCQEVRCAPQGEEMIAEALKQHKIKGEDAVLAAQMAAGRLGWAMHMVTSGALDSAKQSIADLQSLARQGIAERLTYARQLADQADCRDRVEYWLRWVHTRLPSSDKAPKVLRNLLKLHQLLGQPQFNHRLAIENFLINL
jgi:DNA polymerase-3 subunit delta'